MQTPSSIGDEMQTADHALNAESAGLDKEEFDKRVWKRRMRLTGWLLVAWFVVTFGVSFFARELSVVVGGWPFSFWVAAQGALLVYVALVLVFARQMNRLDDERDAADR